MSFFDDQQGSGPAAASLKLPQVGAAFQGVIEHISTGWKSKYNPNPNAPRENEVGPDGQPIPELRVVVAGTPDNYATASKPLMNEQGQPQPDDGRRMVYIAKGTNISFATAAALKEISPQGGPLKDLEVGGRFAVLYEKDISTANGAARGHLVRYQAPAPNSGGFFGGQAQQAPAPTQQAAPQNVTQTAQFQQAAQQQGFQQPPVQNPPQQGWQQPQTAPQPGGWPQGQVAPAQGDPNAPGQQFQQPAAPAADPWAGQPQQVAPQGWAPGQVSENPPF